LVKKWLFATFVFDKRIYLCKSTDIEIMTRIKHYKSNLLFPRTSMLIGFGSILNISGNYFEFDYSNSEKEADIKAIENDWGVVGNDIPEAISTSQKSLAKNQK